MSADHDFKDGRPHKKPRTEDPPPQPATTTAVITDKPKEAGIALDSLKRHEEFWFDDGSVVLLARDTGFRVFRSLLAAQSTVFSDMLSSSSPNAEEMFEGCPVVHLSDSPQDVAHFLRVLLPKSRRTLYARNARIPFRKISAIVRLAHKYHVQDLLDQAILALEEHYTCNFATWDSKTAKAAVVCKLKHAIGVVNLARLVDKPSLLPTAFYECALLGGRVVNGYKREDKSTEHLAQADVVRCIDGRNKLAAKAVALVSEVFVLDPCDACATPSRCTGALKTMLEDALSSDDASDPDVLHGWGNAIKDWAEALGLCAVCKQDAINRDAAERKQVWAALPDIFDIKVEGWSVGGEDESHSAGTNTAGNSNGG